MSVKKSVVLLSGGQDSTTCLFWAREVLGEPLPVIFEYGQKHGAEIERAKNIAREAGIDEYRVINVPAFSEKSALINPEIEVDGYHEINTGLPATFTPGRNALFLTFAAAIAHERGISDVVTGVCQNDYQGYPDCREDFIKAQEHALRLALSNNALKIHTPLMHLDKARTWKLAKDMGCFEIVRSMTLTDYNGDTTMNDWGMGRLDNEASRNRADGYYKALNNNWI